MKKRLKASFIVGLFCSVVIVLSGCQTTKSAMPYEVSTESVAAIRSTLGAKKAHVDNVTLGQWVSENLRCRLSGEATASPDSTLSQYIADAFQKDLLAARAYDAHGTAIEARIEALSFSSVSPAYWTIRMHAYSSSSNGYPVSVTYPFETNWMAVSACKDTTDAFAPAVRDLIRLVVTNPQFAALAGK